MEKELILKQSIIDFSEFSSKFRIKLSLFENLNKILSIIEWKSCEESLKVKEKINYLIWLNKKYENLKEQYKIENFWFQDEKWKLNRNITDFAFKLNEKQINDINLIIKLIEQFYLDRIYLLQNNKEIQELFWIKDLDIINNLEIPIFTRLDLVLSEDWELKIVEIEPIYAWIWECLWTRNIYNNLNKKDKTFVWLEDFYINSLKRFKWKNILFCPNPELKWYYSEVQYLYENIETKLKKFLDCDLCLDIWDLEFNEDWIYFNWKKINILINYFIPKEQKSELDFDKKIIEQFKKWNIKLFPEPCLELDSKLWLALAWDEKFFNNTELYNKFIPKTEIYKNNSRLYWNKILKRTISSLEKNDFFDISNLQEEIKIDNDNVPWIIQEKIKTKKEKIIIMNRKWKIEEKTMFSRIELYIFFTQEKAELWDILVTMWPREIVKWSRDCVMVPVIS